ncbi:RNA polymerase II mediator complex subunit [Microbotryomycetes sp. JL221]|nr:RNA polymerase II mediator complex subunit [Microbotryomycetes sp. JL221]
MSSSRAGKRPPVAQASASLPSASTTGLSNTSHTYAPSTLDDLLTQNGLHRFRLSPPSWRLPWLTPSSSATSKQHIDATPYPQFYPTCDGQDEDQLTEQAVKSGYPTRVVVPTETFSAHQLIYEKLKSSDILSNLSKLTNLVLDRQRQTLPTFDSFAFKLPKRAMLSDHKRELWLNDLANNQVPLMKLYPLIPNVFNSLKDATLLDNLYKRKVPTTRAVWFIRASGASEIQHQIRMRSTSGQPFSSAAIVASFERDWTTALLQFIARQLADITLDSGSATNKPSPATDARKRANDKRPVMVDATLRKEWTQRFSWSLRLLEMLYEEQLVDREAFLKFIVRQIATSNLAQLPFALFLAEEFLSEFLTIEALAARLVSSSLARLTELNDVTLPSSLSSSSLTSSMCSTLVSLVRTIFLSAPDAFISSRLWQDCTLSTSAISAKTMEQILLLDVADDFELTTTIRNETKLLHRRREASSKMTEDDFSTEPDDLDTIQALDSISFVNQTGVVIGGSINDNSQQTTTMSDSNNNAGVGSAATAGRRTSQTNTDHPSLKQAFSRLFHKRRKRRTLQVELPIMFSWATTTDRMGQHRRYVVASLMRMALDDRIKTDSTIKTVEKSSTLTSIDVETNFIEWVDKGASCGGSRRGSDESIRMLLEELIRVRVVSFSLYLQRMIARGETEWTGRKEPSVHLMLLKTVALPEESGPLQARRRVALRSKPTSRLENDRAIQSVIHEVSRLIPSLIGLPPLPKDLRQDDEDCSILFSRLTSLVNQGTHLAVTRRFILEGVQKVSKSTVDGTIELSKEDFALLQEVYLATGDFVGLHQASLLLLDVLKRNPSHAVLSQVLEACTTHGDVWAALDALPSLAIALLNAHKFIKSTSTADRQALKLLRLLANAGHLDSASTIQVEQDYQELVVSLTTAQPLHQGLPSTLPEVQTLISDHSPQAITQLGTRLWYRYHNYESWGALAFESILRIHTQLPFSVIVAFLREINDRLAGGLEPQIGKWINSLSSATLVSTLATNGDRSIVSNLLIELVQDQTLSAVGVLTFVVMPSWKSLISELVVSTTAGDNSSRTIDNNVLLALDSVTNLFAFLTTDWDLNTTAQSLINSASLYSTTDHSGLEAMLNIAGDASVGFNDATTPATTMTPAFLVRKQRSIARRASMFTNACLHDIAQCLSLLVIQQDLCSTLTRNATNATNDNRAQMAAMLTMRIMNCERFQTCVTKNPQGLATHMLDSQFVLSIPAVTSFRPKLLTAVLLVLKDGSTASPASLVSTEDWDTFLSGLTMWRLSISKVEVQACLERLRLDSSLTKDNKADALHTLAVHFLDRVSSGEGHTYLGEQVVKCYHGDASNELVSVAFDRLAEAVDRLTKSGDGDVSHSQPLTTLRCVGRVLNTLLQSTSATCRTNALLHILTSIKHCLESLVRLNNDIAPETETQTADAILHCCHLLSIALQCSSNNVTDEVAQLFGSCLSSSAKLAILLSKRCWVESDKTTILLDTCACLLFALTPVNPASAATGTTANTLSSHGGFNNNHVPSLTSLITSDEFEVDVLPDSTVARLTRLFAGDGSLSSRLTSSLVNPWDLVDSSDAIANHAASNSSSTVQTMSGEGGGGDQMNNNGPIDMNIFDAKVVQTIPNFTAFDAMSESSGGGGGSVNTGVSAAGATANTPAIITASNAGNVHLSSHPHSTLQPPTVGGTGGTRRGRQSNFDFETPCTGLSVAARDHRRTITSARQNLISKYDPLASQKKAAAAAALAQQHQHQQQQQQQQQQAAQAQAAQMAAASAAATQMAAQKQKEQTQQQAQATSAGPSKNGKDGTSSTTTGTKRKEAPDLVIISDDDDEDATTNPSATMTVATTKGSANKKQKTTAATTKTTRGAARRKSKGG